jgi:hypothetical protein
MPKLFGSQWKSYELPAVMSVPLIQFFFLLMLKYIGLKRNRMQIKYNFKGMICSLYGNLKVLYEINM